MKLHELLNKYSNKEILEELHKNYSYINDNSFISALNEMRNLKSNIKKQDIKIVVKYTQDCFDCFCTKSNIRIEGKTIEEKELIFSNWDNLLVSDIDNISFINLDELTVLAHIIWYMIIARDFFIEKEELEKRNKETLEHPEKFKSYEEQMNCVYRKILSD